MLIKIGKIIWNSIKTLKFSEFVWLFGIPLLIVIPIYLGLNSSIIKNDNNFIQDFINKVITITTVLSAFGLASLNILVSSSNDNIKEAKNTECKNRSKVNGFVISYYQLQFYRTIAGLLIQFFVLILAIVFTILFIKFTNNYMYKFFYVILYLLIVSLLFQIFSITSIYYLFVSNKKED